MTKVNGRFLLELLGFVGMLCIGVAVVHAYQVDRQADFLLEEARDASEAEETVDAIGLYRQYLGFRPDDARVGLEFGRFLTGLEQLNEAYRVFSRATAADPGDVEVAAAFVDLALKLGNYGDAATKIATTLLADDPEDPEHLMRSATASIGLREFERAIEVLEQAIATGDAPPLAYGRLAEIRGRVAADVTAGLRLLDGLVYDAAEDPEARVVRGRYWLKIAKAELGLPDGYRLEEGKGPPPAPPETENGEGAEADDDFRPSVREVDRDEAARRALADADAALELAPDSEDVIRFGIEATFRAGEFERLDRLTELAITTFPQRGDFYQARAESLLRVGDVDGAVDALRRGVAAAPRERVGLAWSLLTLLIDSDRIEQAATELSRFQGERIPDSLIRYAEGRIAAGRGEWREAIALLEQARGELVATPRYARLADYQLAICYREVGDDDRRIDALRRVLASDPNEAAARAELALALVSVGRLPLAIDEFRQVIATGKADAETLLTLAKLQITDNVSRAESARRWRPVDDILATIEKLARKSLENSGDGDPPPGVVASLVETALLKAEAAYARDNTTTARVTIRNALEEFPDSETLAVSAALFDSRFGEFDQAEAALEEAAADFGDGVAIRRAKAVVAVERAEETRGPETDLTGVAARIVELATPPEDWDEEAGLDLRTQFYPLLFRVGAEKEAIAAARAVAEGRPADLQARLFLLDRAAEADDLDALRRLLREVRQVTGEGAVYNYAAALGEIIAARLGSDGPVTGPPLESAFTFLGRAALQRPFWPDVPTLAARLHQQNGDEEAALRKFFEAFALGERDPEVVAELVLMLNDRGRYVEADGVLRQYETYAEPVSGLLGRVATAVSLRLSDFERAGRFANLTAADSDSTEDKLWLAQVRAIVGDFEGAEAVYRETLAADPANERVRLAWLQFLARTNRLVEAIEALDGWNAEGPADPMFVAEGYVAVGRGDLAVEALNDTAPKDPAQLDRVLGLLRSAANRKTVESYLVRRLDAADGPELIRALRRELAIVIAADRDDPGRIGRALKMIEGNQTPDWTGKIPFADRRAKAVVLAAWPTTFEQSLAAFEELFADGYEATPEDRLVVAALRIELGDWAVGSEEMRRLILEGERIEPRHALRYAEALAGHGEVDEARLWIDRLWDSSAPANELARAAAEIEFLLGRHEALSRELQLGYGRIGERLAPDARLTLLGVFAERCEAAGRPTRAALYRQSGLVLGRALWAGGDGFTPAQADMLVSSGKIDEALDRLDEAVSDLPPAMFLITVERILLAEVFDDGDAARLELIIEKADSARVGNDVHHLIAFAQLAEKVGRFERAIGKYRAAAVAEPDNPVVANNLAVLLALTGRDTEEALTSVNRAIASAGPREAFFDTKGVALIAARRPKEALPYLDRAARTGTLPIAKFHLVWALADMDQTTAAEKILDELLATGFSADDVHPLEREKFEQLVELLDTVEF